jgi:Cu+-exporting ATPase
MTANAHTLTLAIDGMHCASCALLIDDALADLPGVHTCTTSTRTNTSMITYDRDTTRTEIIATIEELGYHARALDHAEG